MSYVFRVRRFLLLFYKARHYSGLFFGESVFSLAESNTLNKESHIVTESAHSL